MTRDRTELADNLCSSWRRNRGYYHMSTEAEPFTDRVWMRTGILGQSALGGTFGGIITSITSASNHFCQPPRT